jgi:Tol biopolymer transport system component
VSRIFWCVLALVAAAALSFPRAPIRFHQLTHGGSASFPNTAPALGGRAIAFLTNADLTGDNPDGGWEIFLAGTDGTLRQLTQQDAGDSADPVLNLELSGDRKGAQFVFSSSADLVGDNSDRNHEIFRVTAEGELTQLTHTLGGASYCGGNVQPTISGDGTRLVFASDLDLAGNNSDGNCEIFGIEPGGRVVQITSGKSGLGAVNPALSDDGKVLVFASDENLGGDNGDGNVELWVVRGDDKPHQLTHSSGGFYGFLGSFYPRLSADGKRAVFISGRDLAGENPDHNAEVFTLLTDGGATPRQVTRSTPADGAAGSLDNYFPAISADGRRIAFTSVGDIGLGGPSFGATDIYLADFDGSNLRRVTRSANASDWPALSDDGSRLYFQSFADLSGENGDHKAELFSASVE